MNNLDKISRSCTDQILAPTEPSFVISRTIGGIWSREAYLRNSRQILAAHDLASPDRDRLILVVEAALAAQSLWFAAVLHEPSTAELYEFFEEFVLRCVKTCRKAEA
jgi:hypothetical protein